MIKNGYIRTLKREVLGVASHETRSTGYGVDLIRTLDAETLRRDARRVSLLLAKLTLNLPCFGRWMPESCWDAFLAASEALQGANALAPTVVRDLAAEQCRYLTDGGLEVEINNILARLEKIEVLVAGKRDALRDFLLPHLRNELALRTPDVLATCVEFRTARQRWSPFEQTDMPYRQLMVDVIQATLAATYRTGDWPQRFRSYAAKRVAEGMEDRLRQVGRSADGDTAMAILDQVATWEDAERAMTDVVCEFRRLVDDELAFPAPEPDVLTKAVTTSATDGDEGGSDDDDVR